MNFDLFSNLIEIEDLSYFADPVLRCYKYMFTFSLYKDL